MIKFKKISWKNFLSTGNQPITINLEKEPTTLIIGSNGAGKSTILDALTFSLFNKPYRKINKSQLINSVNEKDCRVEIEFDIGSRNYKIVRGIKPSLFEIYVDDKMLNQDSTVVDQQKYLENNILKLNYKSFTQIVILGSSNFVPFMQLSSSNRREVIEDILDIRIFSSMNAIIKDKIKQVKDEVKILELKKDGLSDKVSMQKDFIRHLEEESQLETERKIKKIDNLENNITEFSNQNKVLANLENEKRNAIESLSFDSTKLRKLGNLKGKISGKISMVSDELKFFHKNEVCPTCTQSIEKDFKSNKIIDIQNKEQELQKGLSELQETIFEEEKREDQWNKLSKEINKINNNISQNNTVISGLQRQIRDIESEIKRLNNQLENRTEEQKKLNEFQSELTKTFDKLVEKKDDLTHKNFVYSLLKDGGVKTKIIKKYLPLINKHVNKYLQMMDFYINFTLNEEFNEKIQSPIHEDFSYSSFSEGEKMRIDLSLLFTWREIAAFKNSTNTNLLIMDEVFDSSLDGFGTDEFLRIIRYTIKNANVFIISHKEGLQDKFENVVQFDKIKGFSRIV